MKPWHWMLILLAVVVGGAIFWMRRGGGGGLVTKVGAGGALSTAESALPPADMNLTLSEVDAAIASLDGARVR